jgi:hypothetical protein
MSRKTATTVAVDLGVLLALVAISFGIWFYPWGTLLLLALILIGGYLFGENAG